MPDTGSLIINFGTNVPSWLLIVLCLIAILIAYLQYRKDQNFSLAGRISLFSLRLISLLLLLVILSEPAIRTKKYDEIKNEIAVYFDLSSSIESEIRSERNASIIQRFFSQNSTYPVNYSFYIFGQNVEPLDNINSLESVTTNFSVTDLEKVHNHIKASSSSMALVLSDGIHTTGVQPYFDIIGDKSVYSIVFGDTTLQSTLAIEDVVIPEKVYTDESFPFRTIVDTKNLSNEQLSIKLFKKDNESYKLIADSTLILGSDSERISFSEILTPSAKSDEMTIKVEVSTSTKSTSRTKIISVVDKELKVASIATSLHPDVAATRRLLREIKSISLSSINYFNEIENIGNLDTNSVLIVHASLSNIKLISSKFTNIPVIGFINGSRNSRNRNYVLSDINFDKETSFSSKLKIPLEALPPLRVSIPALNIENSTPLLYADIKEFNTSVPTIFLENGDPKHIFITADSWYRWFNYPSASVKEYSQGFLLQLIDWVKSSNAQSRINPLSWPTNWVINKKYNLSLSVLDEVGRNDKDAIIEYNISGEDLSEIKNGFTKANAEGINELSANFNEEGAYSIKLKASKAGQVIDSTTVKIYVETVNLESEWKTAQPKILQTWVANANGENLGYADSLEYNLAKFEDEIKRKGLDEISYIERIETIELAKTYWWFILLIILLTTEWFIRRTKNAL
jgi:hypothetical protein